MTDKIQSIKVEFLNVLAQIEALETDVEQQEALSAVQSYLVTFNAATNLAQLSEEKPDLSQIPLWGGKIKDGSAIEWLDKHYGKWLKRCGADQNYIYRKDIVAHDAKLVKAVEMDAYMNKHKPRDYIPTRSDRVTDNVEKFNITSEVERTVNTIKKRKHRSLSITT